MSVPDFVHKNNVIRHALAREFLETFHTSLSGYFDNLLGFDVVLFDDGHIHSGEESMADVVRERYGDGGVLLIEQLLGVKPLSPAQREVACQHLRREYVDRNYPLATETGDGQ